MEKFKFEQFNEEKKPIVEIEVDKETLEKWKKFWAMLLKDLRI
jgi:hypothetical protein